MKAEEQYEAILKRIIRLAITNNRSDIQEEELLCLYQQIELYYF